MKYLKKFNENNSIDDFESMSKDYLAYLLDDDVSIEVSEYFDSESDIYVIIDFIQNKQWNDIKDIFISYIDYVNSEYKFAGMLNEYMEHGDIKIEYMKSTYTGGVRDVEQYKKYVSVEDVLNDKVYLKSTSHINIKITHIAFIIKSDKE